MTTLAAQTLETTLTQPITIDKPINMIAIQPWIYFNNMPVGTFYLTLKKDMVTIKQWSFNSQDAKDSFNGTQNYFHVYLSLTNSPIKLVTGDYELILSSTGYVAGSSFVAWCKDWQGVVGRYDGQASDFTAYPYSFRILETKGREQWP